MPPTLAILPPTIPSFPCMTFSGFAKSCSISQKCDENAAVCNQCNAVISCKGANTSNMLKLLSTQHGIKYQERHVFRSLRKCHTSVDIKYPALAHCCLATASSICSFYSTSIVVSINKAGLHTNIFQFHAF